MDGKSGLSFLNTNKYPPSLDFLIMTLGPALLLLAFIEKKQNRFTQRVVVYGKVPFFYFVVHFFILHLLLVMIFFASGHSIAEAADPRVPFLFRPANFEYGLKVVYLIWLSLVCALYFPCRWFHKYKTTHNQWWLKYL